MEAHAKLWQNDMDALHKDVRALHPDVQDIDWLFCSNNPLSLKVVIRAHKFTEVEEINKVARNTFQKDDRQFRVVREFVSIRVRFVRVYVYKVGDNKRTINRMNRQGHFRDLKLNTQEGRITEDGAEETILKEANPSYGFANHPIDIKGYITLPVTLEDESTPPQNMFSSLW
ncbi:hypothetical protein PVK06_039187 [Gossypium arboreum]|uniref:Uncharacterized protein n=1 Tax=Gossypium arboreum TaxID=29729 RepID=A0ABR0N285_GOSAR|nr:hypothetical protein PVK06_039187 [Gossypium arboreum]